MSQSHGYVEEPAPHVARIASLQDGIVTTMQLAAGGVSGNQVSRWVRRGHLHRIHRGVYAVGHVALSVRAWQRAALLAVGRDATLCLWSASSHLGLSKWAPDVVHVAVSTG
ncbi:MAG TPA: type IV toxin-antitoxin system AbiEi family antitoxin domain-containing protein, partial [Baekduia sp.]|nr:type IV toxin-antitoxin system AbiEi family antitoxin domain-containing protein [Baekduia sp.]